MIYETRFLVSLLFTLLLEIPIVVFFVKKVFKLKSKKINDIVFIGLLASMLTLPYLWFVLLPFINLSYYILVGELIVILAETLIYKKLIKLRFFQSLLVSLIANLVSFLFGLLLRQIL